MPHLEALPFCTEPGHYYNSFGLKPERPWRASARRLYAGGKPCKTHDGGPVEPLRRIPSCTERLMFRAIGIVIILVAVRLMLPEAFDAFGAFLQELFGFATSVLRSTHLPAPAAGIIVPH